MLTPEELFYLGEYDRISEFTDTDGNTHYGHDARIALVDAFSSVLLSASAADPSFNPSCDMSTYSRTTFEPGRVRHDDVWQPYQAESATEARSALYALGCPAQPFSAGASEALMTRGTDASVPSDLSGLPDNGDGTATV